MVKNNWVQVKWMGFPSFRYLFLIMPNGQRVIIDHWGGFNIFYYMPIIKKYQKYNAYFIPETEDISSWENMLVSELDMVVGSAKIATGTFLAKLGGGAVIAGIFGGLTWISNPLVKILEMSHIPFLLVIILLSLLLFLLTNTVSKHNLKKKVPLAQFEYQKKVIKIKFKDIWMTFAQGIIGTFTVFFLMLLTQHYDAETFVYMTILTWFALCGCNGIVRTADLYINDKPRSGQGS